MPLTSARPARYVPSHHPGPATRRSTVKQSFAHLLHQKNVTLHFRESTSMVSEFGEARVTSSRAMRLGIRAVIALLVSSAWVPTGARAADAADDADSGALQEIVVTAEKREEKAKDVPVTITAFDGTTLQERGLTGLEDYAKYVPGLIYNGSGLGERSGPDIVIRGVANSRLFDFETNIATATTGFVYGELPAYAFDPELIDVQRVEVLKGPQGTLYGAAAMGGLVKVVPNLPQFDEYSGMLQAGVSALDNTGATGGLGWTGAGFINIPLSDILALRFSFHGTH